MNKKNSNHAENIVSLDWPLCNTANIPFELNWKTLTLSLDDSDIIKVKDILTQHDFKNISKNIFSLSWKLYYPNFRNEEFFATKEEIQFVNKDNFFSIFEIILESNSGYSDEESQKLHAIIAKLKTSKFSLNQFYKIQKTLQIFSFIHYFYGDWTLEERAYAIWAVKIANEYSRLGDDRDMVDLGYILHCAKKKNFTHIWEHLKKETTRILEEILNEIS